jgi:hypothetical protein
MRVVETKGNGMGRRRPRPNAWIALLVLLLLAACEEKKSTPSSSSKAPLATDLRVRHESGGFAGEPTRFSLTVAFADADADVAALEVKRLDTREVTTADLPDAAGKPVGLAEGTFEITATEAGNVPMTATIVDARSNRSAELDFVIGIQAPPPPPPPEEEGSSEEALKTRKASRSLATKGARVLRTR